MGSSTGVLIANGADEEAIDAAGRDGAVGCGAPVKIT